ncbi:Ig-like domain-containing protein [Candidatus Falkowbacteria bacterium]|nr:Ig-like domain-containing protein [Candidatus Falkowbacteria bacterium]
MNVVTYTFTTTTVKTNVGDLSLAYTAGTSVTDGTNTAASKTITSASSPAFTDGAAPVIKTITYQDVDLDGKIDRIIFDYSETVTASSVLRANDLVFGNVGSFTGAAFGANATDLITGAVTSTDVDLGTEATAVITNDTSSLLAVSTQNLFSLADGVPNTNTTLGNQSQATYVDGAAPAVVSTTFYDAMGSDGKLDLIGVIWSENISAVANGSADWALTSAANFAGIVEGTVECNSGSAAADECDYGFTTTTVKTNVGDLSLAYTAGTSVTDGTNTAASKTITSASSPAFTDSAAPVIVTTSPASAATDVALDASMVITFSEAMTQASVTGAITRLPSFTLGAAGWTSGDTVLTYAAHDAFAGMQIYTITLAGTIASAAAGDGNLAAGPVANPFSFTTVAAGGGGGGGGGGLPASVMVLSPNGGESWAGLSSKNITWSSTSTTITKVKIYYSLDRGVNFPYTIATNENNDGTYSWTVPNVPSSTVKIKVEGHDESGVFVASDISDADFTITYTTPPPPGAETPPSAENPAGLVAGDLFKSPLSTTVYYFGSDNKRHIFPNEKTYKSWYPDWSNVKSVTAEELRAIPLGKNVTVRPGTVLVKIDTNPKVYAVEPNGLLRWIPTETRIKTLYGGNWATKIIDVPLAFWGDYFFGSDISTDTHPTGALVQYSGTTDVYYIQGAEKRKVTAAGFTANNFRSENILAIPTTLSYANGADITGAEEMLMKIY